MDLTTATPREIDEQLAAVYFRFYAAQDAEASARRRAALHGDGLAKREAGDLAYSSYTAERLAELADAADAAEAAARAILAETAPFEAEYGRRGGWTRAYLVTSSDGHVHRSMRCTTCHFTTRYAWLTQYSGRTEAEVVEDAGSMACTVCYPTAPIDVLQRASRIEAPEKAARRAERERRAAERAAKGITMPDGSPLRDEWGGAVGTANSARTKAVQALAGDHFYRYAHSSRGEWLAFVDRAVAALAAKENRPEAEIRTDVEARAARKMKRDGQIAQF